MVKPFGSKRRGNGKLAGRYLAAIGAASVGVGACGDIDDAASTSLNEPLTAACGSHDKSNGLDMRNHALATELSMKEHPVRTLHNSTVAAPKTPTKREQQHFSISPEQHLKMQPSPSGATATTVDAFSWATPAAASPSSRKGRGGRSPISMRRTNNAAARASTSHRGGNSNNRHRRQASEGGASSQQPTSSTSFLSMFPSAKIALRGTPSKKQKHQKQQQEAIATRRSPPPPQQKQTHTDQSFDQEQHLQSPTTRPQHLMMMEPNVTTEAIPAATDAFNPRMSPSSTAESAAVLSDLMASEAAPTEITTNRTADRARNGTAKENLWKKKKASWHSAVAHANLVLNNSNSFGAEQSPMQHQQHQHHNSHDDEDDLAEEKKQDSDLDSSSLSPKSNNQRSVTKPNVVTASPKQEEPVVVSRTQQATEIPEGLSEEELLLYGPVPLERINTRRTSNRGKFSQPNAYDPPFTHSQYGQHLLSSRNNRTEQPQPSPSASPTQEQPYDERPKQRFTMIQPKSSPRLHRLLNGSRTGQEGYVRRKGRHETPMDVKSLLSMSTNESSSGVSPNTILDHVLDRNNDNDKPHEANNAAASPGHNHNPHWWSIDRVRLAPRRSPTYQHEEHLQPPPPPKTPPSAGKAVVAYPDSPPSYLKPDRQRPPDPEPSKTTKKPDPEPSMSPKTDPVSSTEHGNPHVIKQKPANKADESNDIRNGSTEAGTSGVDVTEDSDDEVFGPKPLIRPSIPKLAPCKLDPQKRKPQTGTSTTGPSNKTRTQPRRQSHIQPPKVHLKPRKNRNDEDNFCTDDADPTTRSVVSESTAWTPLAMSEDGLNFSVAENAGPLLPLFSQDRFDLFAAGDESFLQPSANRPVSKLEGKLDNEKRVQASTSRKQQQDHNQRDTEAEGHRKQRPPSYMAPIIGPEKMQASRPCPSPEIWRRPDDEEADTATPDPIFCPQPSTSQPLPSVVASAEAEDSPVEMEPIAGAQEENNETATSSAPSQKSPNSRKRWPTVRTNFAGSSEKTDRLVEHSTGPLPEEESGYASQFRANQARTQGIPRRAVSGPVAAGRARYEGRSTFGDDIDDCSKQAEVEADIGTEKTITSTGSVPRRSKSEATGGGVIKPSSPVRGSFQAAFAAFEKANAGHRNKALFQTTQFAGVEKDADNLAPAKSFATSRLALVLHTHLSMEENGSLVDKNQHADSTSVDVHSIRSNFEGVAAVEEDADDDDTASVKSLREVFEPPVVNPRETAVSKMRAFFESPKAPLAKSFETGNAELQSAWNKFESTGPRRKRSFANKDRERPPSSIGDRSTPSLSVSERAKMLVATTNEDIETRRTIEGDQTTAGKHLSQQEHTLAVSKIAMVSVPTSLLSSSDSGAKSSIEAVGPESKDLIEKEIVCKTKIQVTKEDKPPQGISKAAGAPKSGTSKPVKIIVEGEPALRTSEHERSMEISIPSDQVVAVPPMETAQIVPIRTRVFDPTQEATNSAAPSDELVSPPRLGIQSHPRDRDGTRGMTYLPKDFSPVAISNDNKHQANDKDTVSASEEEFSDGVTLDLSIAEVSQLTEPTTIQSKTCDESTIGDVSDGEKTVDVDLMECEAKRSEASSSQQTEAAAPLIARALKRLSDDLSMESRNQIVRLWEKSGLLPHQHPPNQTPLMATANRRAQTTRMLVGGTSVTSRPPFPQREASPARMHSSSSTMIRHMGGRHSTRVVYGLTNPSRRRAAIWATRLLWLRHQTTNPETQMAFVSMDRGIQYNLRQLHLRNERRIQHPKISS